MAGRQASARVVAVTVTALGTLLLAAGLGWGTGDLLRPTSQQAPEQVVPVTSAGWVAADQPTRPGDAGQGLRAGDTAGGAVTYLRVDVPDRGVPLRRGLLQLTAAHEPLPGLVELVAVPDTSWDPDTLDWATAPVLGPVVESVRPAPGARRVVFDVTQLLAGQPGTHTFAVTVPPDHGYGVFAGVDGGGMRPALRLSWTDAPLSPAGEKPAECVVRELLIPSCGVLWGTAPAGHTGSPRAAALREFEAVTGRRQDIYHAYHRADDLFPTEEEVAVAAEGRILFLNWKPLEWSWAQIAAGHPEVDSYLDRLADHIRVTFTDPFFFTVHHEPENDVRPWSGSGWEATDYAAMFRYVVEGLRERGVGNLVTVLNHMAYVPWNAQPWFPELYPGDDVVDWLAWNAYAYSDPGYGYGDFAEMMNRRSALYPHWPGFYTWATENYPDKPFMLGEWGVWHSEDNPGHMAEFYRSVARQTPLFPRIRAMVYFDTPADQRIRDSRPTATGAGLAAFQRLGSRPYFQVRLDPPEATDP